VGFLTVDGFAGNGGAAGRVRIHALRDRLLGKDGHKRRVATRIGFYSKPFGESWLCALPARSRWIAPSRMVAQTHNCQSLSRARGWLSDTMPPSGYCLC